MPQKRPTACHENHPSARRHVIKPAKLGRLAGQLLLVALLSLSLCACSLTSTRSSRSSARHSGKSYVVNGKRYYVLPSAEGYKEKGTASWYGQPFHGRKTASGEVYDMNKLSAAHKTLPLQTWLEVRNLENNKTLHVRVNDRGPFIEGRLIDLSRAAAEELGLLNRGTAKVRLTAVTGAKARELAAREAETNRRVASKQGTAGQRVASAAPAPAAGGTPSQGGTFGVLVYSSADPHKAHQVFYALNQEFPKVNLDIKYANDAPKFSIFIEGVKSHAAADSLRGKLAARGYSQSQVVAR